MKYISIALASVLFFDSANVAFATKQKKVKSSTTLLKDDQSYWNRVLQKDSDSSMATPAPTPNPTPKLTPVPDTPSPTQTPPVEPCEVDVDVICTLDSDPDADCSSLEEVTELQCTGCAPTTLCFTYTAAPCPSDDDLPPGMTSCNDFNGGPQMMADITISNGMNMLIDGTFRIGAEFCISNDGAPLPDELFVFVNAPEGGMNPTANQLSVIDATCSGQGLTLLQNYGALDLVHYINCNGDHDCFVPITYKHTACNKGPTGLTVTEMDRVLNGVELDLLEGINPADLRLEEGECFTKEDPIVAECCAGVGLEVSATVMSEGEDGSICDDTDSVNIDKPIETPLPTAAPTPSTPEPTAATPEPTPTPATPEPIAATPEPTVTPATPEPTAATPEPTVTPATPEPTVTPATPEPSMRNFPPGDECFIQIEVDCTPPSQFEDCDSLTPPRDECGEMVFSMGFRYNGGDCSNSDNVQDPEIFQCEDLNGGPPTEDATSFVVVTDIKGLGINYFTGFVPIGGDFELTNGGDLLGANVNATIYSTDVVAADNILQTMVIHTSCSQVTFLKDVYGAIQLLSFNNTLQGFVSCFVDLTLDFSVINTIVNDAEFTVIVDSLTSITNFDDNLFVNLTEQVAGTQLGPGETLAPLPSISLTIDLSTRRVYTAFTTIEGSSLEGFSCRSTDFLNFTASTTGAEADTRVFSAVAPASIPMLYGDVAPVGIPVIEP